MTTQVTCYVARTKPQQEKWAGRNIRNQGHDYYLPMIYDRKRKREVALFQPYIFPLTSGPWVFLTNTFGVSSVIMLGEKPATLPIEFVDNLRAMENDHGHVELPEDRLEENDRVRFRAGMFAGRIGLYQGQSASDRVRVLLDVLGRKTPVDVSRGLLERAVP